MQINQNYNMRKLLFSTLTLLVVSITSMAQTTNTTASTDNRAKILIETTMGNIEIELYNETPLHRDNFIKLVETHHFYDSLLFHRVIPGFMIQAGDPRSKHAKSGELLGTSSLDYTIPAEIRLPKIYHKRGALAAAREGDLTNPEHRSSSTQFYIVYGKTCNERMLERAKQNLKNLFADSITMSTEMTNTYTTIGGTPHLDGAYTVFGEVTQGMDVVDKIQNVERDANDRPLTDVRIIRATVTSPLTTKSAKPTTTKVTRRKIIRRR